MFVHPLSDIRWMTPSDNYSILGAENRTDPSPTDGLPPFHPTFATTPFHFASSDWSSQLEGQSRNLAKILWVYLGPCIFVVGIVGNLLIILVMGHSNMRGTSTCIYLRWMAVADIFTLLTGMIPEWLEHMDIIILKEVSEVTCKFEKFFNFCSIDMSVWICVVFTIDRFVAVCFPMSESVLCLSANAKFHVAIAFGAAILKNVHILWTRGAEYVVVTSHSYNTSVGYVQSHPLGTSEVPIVEYKLVSNCGSPTKEFRNFENYVRPWIAFVVISLIPCLVIIICNFFIIRSLLMLKLNKNKIPSDTERGTVLQMTVLCLTASICFILCNTPSMIVLIGKPYWNAEHNKTYNLAKPIINQIFYVNHSINFFLYCMTGKRFRESLCLLCRSYKHPNNVYELSRQELLYRGSNRSCNNQALTNYEISKNSLRPKHSPNLLTTNDVCTSFKNDHDGNFSSTTATGSGVVDNDVIKSKNDFLESAIVSYA